MSDETPGVSPSVSVGSRTAGYFCALLLLGVTMTSLIVALARHTEPAGAKPVSRGANGEPTPVVHVDLSEFNVQVSQFASAPSGDVTFEVKNTGSIDHEMLVFKTDAPFNKLPIVDGGDPPVAVKTRADKVDEAPSVGETGNPNLRPGETRTFTIKHLVAGRYALICNLASHYGLGMRAAFTTTDQR